MAAINKPSQPLIPPTDVEEVEEIATNVAEAAIAADDTHAPLVDDKVPAANLPSYVDDVLEYDDLAAFPNPGEEGKIYVARDTNNTYRWSGSAYVQVGGSEIDLTPYALKTEVAADLAVKQDALISGTNIKTINGESVLGEGNLEINGFDGVLKAEMDAETGGNVVFVPETKGLYKMYDEDYGDSGWVLFTDSSWLACYKGVLMHGSYAGYQPGDMLNLYGDEYVSTANLKTINGQSIYGSGDLEIGLSQSAETEVQSMIDAAIGNVLNQEF